MAEAAKIKERGGSGRTAGGLVKSAVALGRARPDGAAALVRLPARQRGGGRSGLALIGARTRPQPPRPR
jgi:hypothetical protein